MTNTKNTTATETTHTFATSSEAWAFMKKCDENGIAAGYPSLKAPYTVRVLEGVRS